MSATEIKFAFIVINVGGPFGNSTVGYPPPSQQQANDQYVVDAVNASGGAACRKLVPVFFQANAADPTDLQQTCLNIVQAHLFFVVDPGAYYLFPQLTTCFAQNQNPLITTGLVSQQTQLQFYPYLFSEGLLEPVYRNMVFGLAQRGFFSTTNGFRKVGLFYRDCAAQLPAEVLGWLHQAGLSSAQILTHDAGCPAGFDSPSDIEQAILSFKSAGVTHVIEVQDPLDFPNFTSVAQQQGFHPKYGLAEDGTIPVTYTNLHPDYQNIANAIVIDQHRWGEERTPGMVPSAGTARCNAIFVPHGQQTVWQQSGGVGGNICNSLWLFQAAIDNAPTLERSSLAAGLQATKSIDFSFPWGPSDFSAPRTTYGDQFWRVDQFMPGCTCWQLVDPTFHPSFP